MSITYTKTELTGGGAGALDGIDGNLLSDGDCAIVVTDENVFFYTLVAIGADPEDGWRYIAPDNNAGTKMWCISVLPVACKGNFVGGFSAATLSDNDEYDPDTWVGKTDLSSGRRNLCGTNIASMANGYVFGGIGATNDVDAYSRADAWTSKTDLPSPGRYGAAAAAIEDRAYVFGGYGSVNLRDTDEYNPGEDAWVSKTDMPLYGRKYLAAATIDGNGYVFGGQDNYGAASDTDEYSPDTWVSKATMPSPARYFLAAAAIGDKGYVFGGYAGASAFYDTDQYDPDTWLARTNMPYPARYMQAAAGFNGHGYIVGGSSPSQLADTDQYISDTWVSKTNMPSPPRYGHAAMAMW
jgi:hypothetical protein